MPSDFAKLAALKHLACIQGSQLVGERESIVEIVGDQDDRDRKHPPELARSDCSARRVGRSTAENGSSKGHRVVTGANGRQGLEALARERPYVVFLDYMMPTRGPAAAADMARDAGQVLDGAGMLRDMMEDSQGAEVTLLTERLLAHPQSSSHMTRASLTKRSFLPRAVGRLAIFVPRSEGRAISYAASDVEWYWKSSHADNGRELTELRERGPKR